MYLVPTGDQRVDQWKRHSIDPWSVAGAREPLEVGNGSVSRHRIACTTPLLKDRSILYRNVRYHDARPHDSRHAHPWHRHAQGAKGNRCRISPALGTLSIWAFVPSDDTDDSAILLGRREDQGSFRSQEALEPYDVAASAVRLLAA